MAKGNPLRRRDDAETPAKRALRLLRGRHAAARPLALDELIHNRLRLGMVSALAAGGSLSFAELKTLLKTTDGNLSVHARKLEDAGYVRVTKHFLARRPRTDYRLTAAGRRALERYVEHMEAILATVENQQSAVNRG